MFGITDLTKGTVIEYNGFPFLVLSSSHLKIGRGGGMQKVKMKNLVNGGAIEVTFRGSEKISKAEIDEKIVQYLYKDDENFYFMDTESYEQLTISRKLLDEYKGYLKEGENVTAAFYKSKLIKVELPIKMKFKVTKADIGLRGDTTTTPSKPVTIETGMVLAAPLFIKEGDQILIDTRDGKYAGRA